MNFFENITKRRANTRTQSDPEVVNESQLESLLEGSNTTLDATSMIELSNDGEQDECVEINKLSKEVENLKLELDSAHLEIQTLNLANEELRKKNEELIKKNEVLKKVSISPIAKKPQLLGPKLRKHDTNKMKNTSPSTIKVKNDSKTTQTVNTNLNPPSSPINKVSKNQTTQTENSNIKFKHATTSPIPSRSNNKKHKLTQTENITPRNTAKQQEKCKAKAQTSKSQNKNKLHIISCNNTNDIINIARETIHEDFEICHFSTPGGGIRQQLENIEIKLKEFTSKDFCIILMSGNDVTSSNNDHNIINYIRNQLSKVTHTNIIIATPTYNCGRGMNRNNNWRVESFNNLLYLDMTNHKYGHFFDSNANLWYDSDVMFNRDNGYLKDRGMHINFQYINTHIRYIQKCTPEKKLNIDAEENTNNNTQTFFRS